MNKTHSAAGKGAKNPAPEEIRLVREAAGLSQSAAAALVYSSCRAWQQWEASVDDARNHRKMHPAVWELFRLKIMLIARGDTSPSQQQL